MNMNRTYLALLCLLGVYICNQWSRYSIVYLGSVATPACKDKTETDACYFEDGKEEIPLCPSYKCHKYVAGCEKCQQCFDEHETENHNLQYATCLTSAEYGILNSYGYSLIFSFCGLVAGRVADLYNRKYVVALASVVWAAATFAQGISESYTELFFVRVFMGASQSFSTPASYSLIADLFSAENRAFANGIYSLGVYVGGGLSSISLVVAKEFGWRTTSFVIALASLAFAAAVLLLVAEPRNANKGVSDNEQNSNLLSEDFVSETYEAIPSSSDEANQANETAETTPKPVTLSHAVRLVFSDGPVSLLFAASGLRFFGGFAIASFLPIFFKRKYPDENLLYGTLNAFVISFGGALSASLGGWLTDKFSKNDERAKVWIPAAGFLLGYVPFLAVLYVDNFYVAISALFFEYIFAECWFGPAIALMQNRIPSEARGITISMFLFIASMVGNISPLLLGHLDDGNSVKSVSSALALLVGISYIGSSIIFILIGTRIAA